MIEKFFDSALGGIGRVLVAFGVLWLFVTLNSDERGFDPFANWAQADRNERIKFGTFPHHFLGREPAEATANAVEHLATRAVERPLINNAIWLGLALWGLQALRRTQHAMERLADKVAPVKVEPAEGDKRN